VAEEREPVPPRGLRRVPAWIVVALVLVATIVGVRADEGEPGLSTLHSPGPPRFLLTAGSTGDPGAHDRATPRVKPPWFQVHALDAHGLERLADSVRSPSREAGVVGAIVGGPDGMFVAMSSRARPCESRLYRFRLTADGHATGLAPVPHGIIPALAAGLAISPDGRRIAYTTTACANVRAHTPLPLTEPQPARTSTATLTVLDLDTGARRTWTAGDDLIVGEIVWARDSRTLGHSIARLRATPQPSASSNPYAPRPLATDTIADVTVRALNTGGPGGDLLTGRVLFHPPNDAGLVTVAIMHLDGRTGYGALRKGDPPTTVLFSFAEGTPMRVTSTIPPEPQGTTAFLALAISSDEGPRYACLNGLDAFGRVIDGEFVGHGFNSCTAAYGY
jgi:hypothetical protein